MNLQVAALLIINQGGSKDRYPASVLPHATTVIVKRFIVFNKGFEELAMILNVLNNLLPNINMPLNMTQLSLYLAMYYRVYRRVGQRLSETSNFRRLQRHGSRLPFRDNSMLTTHLQIPGTHLLRKLVERCCPSLIFSLWKADR